MKTGLAKGGRMHGRAALLAGAAAVALLAWGWMKPADGQVPGWEPVNGPVAAAVASLSAEGMNEGGAKPPVDTASHANAADPAGKVEAVNSAAGRKEQAESGAAIVPDRGDSAVRSNAGVSVQEAAGTTVNAPPIATDSGAAAAGSQVPVRSSDGSTASANSAASGLLNINAATVSELDALPGIGPAKAEAIVQYRETHGRFKKAEELKNVKGIGDKLLAKLLPFVTAG